MATTKLMTADDVWLMNDDARVELIRGELREMAAAGGRHGAVAVEFTGHLWAYARLTGSGHVYSAETGFVLEVDPDTLLVPDASFVRSDRLPASGVPIGFFYLAPDLVVEVRSPSNSLKDVLDKVAIYRRVGMLLIWAADPVTETVTAYWSDGRERLYRIGDDLDGGDVLPGFLVPVAEFFS